MKKFVSDNFFILLMVFLFFAPPSIFWIILACLAPGSGAAIYLVFAIAFCVTLFLVIIIPIYVFLWSKNKKNGIVVVNFILAVLISRLFVSHYTENNIDLYYLLLPTMVLLCMLSNFLEKKFLLANINVMIFLLTIAFCLSKNFELYFGCK